MGCGAGWATLAPRPCSLENVLLLGALPSSAPKCLRPGWRRGFCAPAGSPCWPGAPWHSCQSGRPAGVLRGAAGLHGAPVHRGRSKQRTQGSLLRSGVCWRLFQFPGKTNLDLWVKPARALASAPRELRVIFCRWCNPNESVSKGISCYLKDIVVDHMGTRNMMAIAVIMYSRNKPSK